MEVMIFDDNIYRWSDYKRDSYLTEISSAVTHHSPTYWIDYFTRQELTRLLADKSLSLADIAYKMNFSSISYFSRYCKRVLGVVPSKMREE